MSHLVIAFCKYPRAGRVKTRLAGSIGDPAALVAYEMLLKITLTTLSRAGGTAWLAYDPPTYELEMRHWLEMNAPGYDFVLKPQPAGDLGKRLETLMQQGFSDPSVQSVTLIGADCPGLQPHHFTEAWAAIAAGCDVVYGPAADGGFYLQTLRCAQLELFRAISWSSAETLAQCLQRASSLGLRVAQLEVLSDVDTVADWRAFQDGLAARMTQ